MKGILLSPRRLGNMAVTRSMTCSSSASPSSGCSPLTILVCSGSAVAPDIHTWLAYLILMTVTYCNGSTCEELNSLTPITRSSSLQTECKSVNTMPGPHCVACAVFSPNLIKSQRRPNIRVWPKPHGLCEIMGQIRLHVKKWRKNWLCRISVSVHSSNGNNTWGLYIICLYYMMMMMYEIYMKNISLIIW